MRGGGGDGTGQLLLWPAPPPCGVKQEGGGLPTVGQGGGKQLPPPRKLQGLPS